MLSQTKKRVIAGLAAVAAIPAFGVTGIINTPTAEAAYETPDNYTIDIEHYGFDYGYVMWNDYKDSDHSYDLDDLWVTDKSGDGQSIEVTVYRNGEYYESAHSYYGETEKIYLWNVRKGEKVFWTACKWEKGIKGVCENHWSRD